MAGKRLPLLVLIVAVFAPPHVTSRAVNISSAWLLPEEGFPVFYRYFRDRITWFEADAVCQFHHAQLVTVDWSTQYDAARAYLKELDVTNNVWIGLKRANAESDFTWTDYKGLESGGYWAEALPTSDAPVCAALDPAADFRWHPLNCGGPEVASFICQLEVPVWARQEDGCMLTSLPSLTVTYLPEQGAVELISDCGLEGTRRIACKGQANREEMMKQLSCETSTEATSSGGWDNELPTRHRRDTDVTPDMASEQSSLPTTEGLTEVDVVEEVTVHPASMDEELQPSTTLAPEVSSQVLPQEMSAAEEPVQTSPELLQEEINSLTKEISAFNSTAATTKPAMKENELAEKIDIALPEMDLKHNYAGITSDEASETNPGGRKNVVLSSKPLPPSLRGNSPFIDPSNITSKSNSSSEEKDDSKPIEKESHEVFREAKSLDVSPADKTEGKVEKGLGAVFPPLSVYPSSKEESEEVTSAENHTSSLEVEHHVKATNNGLSTTESIATTGGVVGDDAKFFVRVNTEVNDKFVVSSSTTQKPSSTQKAGSDNDFLFVLTESPEKAEERVSTSIETSKESMEMGAVTQQDEDEEQALEEGTEPEVPERPNRGRLLVRPQHHSFYPSLLNRVLG